MRKLAVALIALLMATSATVAAPPSPVAADSGSCVDGDLGAPLYLTGEDFYHATWNFYGVRATIGPSGVTVNHLYPCTGGIIGYDQGGSYMNIGIGRYSGTGYIQVGVMWCTFGVSWCYDHPVWQVIVAKCSSAGEDHYTLATAADNKQQLVTILREVANNRWKVTVGTQYMYVTDSAYSCMDLDNAHIGRVSWRGERKDRGDGLGYSGPTQSIFWNEQYSRNTGWINNVPVCDYAQPTSGSGRSGCDPTPPGGNGNDMGIYTFNSP